MGTLALKERTDYLKTSVEKYVSTEMKSLKDLKDNLDLEITNITSNTDLMEKNLDDGTTWDDVELMDCKDIFIKMMDWIRNYDTSNEEYNRKIRFTCHDTVNDMARRILEIGDLKMQENKGKDGDDYESRSSGLSRSKSDHRLVSEFRRNEESSPPMRRRALEKVDTTGMRIKVGQISTDTVVMMTMKSQLEGQDTDQDSSEEETMMMIMTEETPNT